MKCIDLIIHYIDSIVLLKSQVVGMEEEMNINEETYTSAAEGLDECNSSEDDNVNEIEKEGFRDKKNKLVRKRASREETRYDGRNIFDYSIFGDVLAFDATYGRNKYKFSVVIFSGVNHHKQTIVFVAAVVSNETYETYVWLLEKFLEAMNEKQLKCVITDGDLSMKNAIRRIQQSSGMKNVENFTEEQVRDPVRVRAKGRAHAMSTRGKRGN
ncbi:hypothetical protein Lal_00008172 [Lupinus albus]|nr:hypothetical protein Lal_00008172 [Lupinus albus]